MAKKNQNKKPPIAKKSKVLPTCIAIFLMIAVLVVLIYTLYDPWKISDQYDYYAEITIRDYGKITVKLEPDVAPITVQNFVYLAADGFYDGLTFHRIIEGFMMQGGMSDNPPEAIYGEFTENGWENNLLHKRGVISMARTNDPDSASSQFFIMHQDYPSLNGKYAAFGFVVDGIEVVDAVCENAKPLNNNGAIKEDERPVIESIIIRKEHK